MSELNHTQVPRPSGKVVSLDKVDTLEEAIDYMLGGYHASVDNIEKLAPELQEWREAAGVYLAAHLQIAGLKALPGDHVAKAKELIAAANAQADEARAKVRKNFANS